VNGIVIDASVVGKWFLGDEDDADRALGLRVRLIDGDLEGFAPPHLPLELAGALVRSVRRGRLPAEAVAPSLAALDAFSLEVDDLHGLARSAADVGLAIGVHPYDAAYLVVARARGAPLVTADEPLYQAGLRAGFDVVLLRDLPI
jgi:predicted nucleic acid-binding protein